MQLEEERDRLEGDKLELAGARHMIEADFKEKLRRDHAELAARHEQFSAEHASVVDHGPGHQDEDYGEPPLREDQGDVVPAQ